MERLKKRGSERGREEERGWGKKQFKEKQAGREESQQRLEKKRKRWCDMTEKKATGRRMMDRKR